MKCTMCNQNEATVFYREIVNGKESRYALCKVCAAKKESSKKTIFSDKGFEKGLFDTFFAPTSSRGKRQEEKRCHLCASTFKDLQRMGKVGCPVCYSAFEEELAPTLNRLHKSAVHVGKRPEGMRTEATPKDEISVLEQKLRVAVSEEKYEDAAVIRDKIRELKASL